MFTQQNLTNTHNATHSSTSNAPTGHRCPDCHGRLRERDFCGMALKACSDCGGLWLDAGELRTLIVHYLHDVARLEQELRAEVLVASGLWSAPKCPCCDLQLEEYYYAYNSPILLNACPQCGGQWVRNGVLSQIQRWKGESRHTMSVLSVEQQHRLASLRFQIEHENTICRLRMLTWFFNALRRNRQMWFEM